MSDLDQILSDDPIVDEEPQEEIETPTEEPEVTEPEVAEEPQPEPEPEPEAPAEQMVPLAALQQTRSELQALKQIVQQNQAPPRPAEPAPDVYEDPQGAIRHELQPIQAAMTGMRLDMSEEMTVTLLDSQGKNGREVVDEAVKALESAEALGDRSIRQTILSSKNPYGELVKWRSQQKVMHEIGNDPDAWRKAERAKIEAEVKAQLVAQNAKATPSAPSLASEPNLGSNTTPAWSGPVSLDEILSG